MQQYGEFTKKDLDNLSLAISKTLRNKLLRAYLTIDDGVIIDVYFVFFKSCYITSKLEAKINLVKKLNVPIYVNGVKLTRKQRVLLKKKI